MEYSAVYRVGNIVVTDTAVTGWAYPKEGPSCCALSLWSGESLVRAIRADGYCEKAKDNGIRYGWCQFHVEVSPDFYIFNDKLSFKCIKSGVVLFEQAFELFNFDKGPVRSVRRGSVGNILHDRTEDSFFDVSCFSAVILALYNRFSPREFVFFAYRWILHREADSPGLETYSRIINESGDPMRVIAGLMSEPEFGGEKGMLLQGVFTPNFVSNVYFDPCE